MQFKVEASEMLKFLTSKKKKKGQLATMAMAFAGLILAGLALMVYLYTSATLATALNNANVTQVNNNITQSAVNFTSQLGTVGTIAGVSLILLIIGGVAFFAYRGAKSGGIGI